MTDFVLVHGAWHGSWCWARLRRLLAQQGHGVFTPTLTGLAERSHLLSRQVELETHIADVGNLLIWEDLRDIVLVGHSYGGVIVRHVADRMRDRIRSLVYLDAFVPENGKSVVEYLPSTIEVSARIAGACDSVPNIGYILARGFQDSPFGQFDAVAERRGWWREQFACGHEVMLDMPNELAALLLQRTQGR